MSGKQSLIIVILLVGLSFFLVKKIGNVTKICKSDNIQYITSQVELDHLTKGPKTYFGMFYSTSCPSCHKVGKILDALADQKSTKIDFFVINIVSNKLFC